MAYKKIESGTEEWMFWRDLLKYKEQFNQPENTDSYWQDLHDAGVKLHKQYIGTSIQKFAEEMIFAVINEVSRKCRKE